MKLHLVDTTSDKVILWFDCDPAEVIMIVSKKAEQIKLIKDFIELNNSRFLVATEFDTMDEAMLFRLSL